MCWTIDKCPYKIVSYYNTAVLRCPTALVYYNTRATSFFPHITQRAVEFLHVSELI